MALTHCPTCGADLGGRTICPRCGTLVAAEAALGRFRSKVTGFVDRRRAALPAFGPAHFLWVCAFVPIVIAPPLVSLVVAIAAMRRRSGNVPLADYEWIAIISAVNIVLSGLILYKFHFSPAELSGHFLDFAKDWLAKFWNMVPRLQPSSPRVIPI